MNRTSFLSSISPLGKLLFLLGIILLMTIVSALSGLLAGSVLFDASLEELTSFMSNPSGSKAVGFLKFYQIVNQIGMFIVPAMLFAFLVSNNTFSYLTLNKPPKLISVLIGGLVIYAVLPFNGWVQEINTSITLPEFLSGVEEWMKMKEEQAKVLTEAFLVADTIPGLMVNLIIIAVIPALGEELIFRGILIRLFNDLVKNIHIAVVMSAIVFSSIHLQFYGFFPRFILGLLLGYMFVYTRNLWVPIFVHFINNASSVIIYYLHENGYINIPMEDFGTTQNVVYIIGSFLISIWLMIIIYQKEGADRLKAGRL